MTRVDGHGVVFVAKQLWRVATLTAVAAIGITPQAEAALFYWQDSDPGLAQPLPPVPQQRQRARHRVAKKPVIGERESKPQGPLIISISIAQQKMRIYDANGFFAETPVSTGMPGHPTPMGVFSVIQKHKFHHSNIYSGAPMPYMQRITWSGVAMHAGVLPGRPASHGCIRMPMAFAMKMWNWTKMGARVVIAPGEITPASFSHRLLATLKVAPQPVASDETKLDAPTVASPDKAADAESNANSVVAETRIELRPTVGHGNGANPAADETRPSVPSQTRTADASNTLPAANPSITMSDAVPANGIARPAAGQAMAGNAGDPSRTEAKLAISKSEAEAETAMRDEVGSSDTKTSDEKIAEAKSPASAAPQSEPAGPAKGETAAAAPAVLAEPKKDQGGPIDAMKVAAPKTDLAAPKRSGQIAAFVSRKDSKLYVRQNFSPLFEAPVTIAPSDRALGTHVFTAQLDKDDANVLHWSVVSLPAPVRHADRRDGDQRSFRRRKIAGAGPIEVKPLPAPNSPAEALDRVNLPADAMARITEALSTGGSIIVSDQGIAAGETGEGTDFIVSLR